MLETETRNSESFIEICLEVLGRHSLASAADLGMAYRAWIDEPDLSDSDVVALLVDAGKSHRFEAVRFGGSVWMRGAQISPIGIDMVYEGRVMHLQIEEANRN